MIYFRLCFSFSCSRYDLTLIKKSHILDSYWFFLLLVTAVVRLTAKTTNSEKAIYFLSLISCSINKLKSHILFTCKCFTKTNLDTFIDELTKTIRELFDIENPETIDLIAINHVVSNLEEDMRQDAKVFQLTGNKSLENLPELIVTKMEGNTLKPKSEVTNVAYGSAPIATGRSNDRIDRLEKMMPTILKKIDDKTPSNLLTKSSQSDICSFCNKTGHVGSKCFKRRK